MRSAASCCSPSRSASLRRRFELRRRGPEPAPLVYRLSRPAWPANRCLLRFLTDRRRLTGELVWPRLNQLSFRIKSGILTHTWCCALPEPKEGTHDEIQTDWRCRSPFFCAGRTRDGPARKLPSGLPRPEHLLCDQASRKSPQQVLRLHGLERLAATRRLGQPARQCLLA
jgi:hypothetical protein